MELAGSQLGTFFTLHHSTNQAVQPFWVYPQFERNGRAALAIAQPSVHLVMPQGLGSGMSLIQHGVHGTPQGQGAALVVECGQHFLRASGQLATQVALDFCAYFDVISALNARNSRWPHGGLVCTRPM